MYCNINISILSHKLDSRRILFVGNTHNTINYGNTVEKPDPWEVRLFIHFCSFNVFSSYTFYVQRYFVQRIFYRIFIITNN